MPVALATHAGIFCCLININHEGKLSQKLPEYFTMKQMQKIKSKLLVLLIYVISIIILIYLLLISIKDLIR